MKRYITILDSVTLKEIDGTPARNRETNETIEMKHAEFIRDRTIDPAFTSDTPRDPMSVHWSMPLIVAGETIRSAVRALVPGDVLELDEDDWQLLKRATEKGSYGLGAASCIVFMRAITGATMEDPRKVKEEGEAKEKEALP